jgi:hypothetical protein
MTLETVVLRIPALTDDEGLELAESVGDDLVRLEREPIPEGAFGDLGLTAAVVILSAVALKGLTAYLVTRHRGKTFKQRIEVQTKEGTTVVVVEWQDTSGEPIGEALARTLSTVPGLDIAQLLSRTS